MKHISTITKTTHALIIALSILLVACTTIASLPNEPAIPKEQTIQALTKYESELVTYALHLQIFLTNTKKAVKDKDYPTFDFFDATKLKKEQTIDSLNANIAYIKRYIAKTKPIAMEVYKKHSKRLFMD
ncbi:BBA14 family lipoprotein [Candidatus Borreliella tachyglossi]|uniref:BBA14 family lipoprotein n=1 Tax=Candidatus Borreliella tachyglossi TaxID=1964448 RepID=UPI0040424250